MLTNETRKVKIIDVKIANVLCPTCHMYMIPTINNDKSVFLECCEKKTNILLEVTDKDINDIKKRKRVKV